MASHSISDDIRKNVRNGLSLECDAKLLQYMEIISNKLINRAKTTSKNIDALSSELERTSICLDNVTNRLSSLSHTKFVENRVYEDDETIANIKEVPVEIKTKEYNPIKTLNTVIKNNMKMLENCYEKVSVELDDSDEEDEQIKSIVYRPKNKFETRPIPHLIGSKEWKEKWHIGIYDSDESFSENENEEFSDGSDSLSLPSNGPTISESGSSVWSINRNNKFNNIPNKRNDYTSSDEEISTTSKTSSNDTKQQRDIRNLPQIPSVHVQQRYYVHQPKEKGLFDESSESENEKEKNNTKQKKILHKTTPEPLPRQQHKQQSNKISNILNDEPPELDTVLVKQKTNKIPSELLFDSDEGELMNQNEHEKSNSAQIHIPQSDNVRKKTVNLFDDDEFNSFMKELDQKTNEKLPKATDRNINLFVDQNEEEIKHNTKNIPQVAIRKINLFTDKTDQEKIPKIIEKENSLFDQQSIYEINANTINSTPKNIEESSTKAENNLRTSLFEDDLFSSTVNPIKNILEKPLLESTSKTKISNLFDDTPPDDDFDSLFKTSSTILKKSLISEEIVGSTTSLPNVNNNKSLNISPILKTSLNIFNDDIEDKDENIFKKQIDNKVSSNSLTLNNTNEKGKIEILDDVTQENIFNVNTENENIFKNNKIVIKNTNENEITEQPIKYANIFNNKEPVSNSLFDDMLADDDDFFKSLANTENNNTISDESTKPVENIKTILDTKLEKAQNKTNDNKSTQQIKILDDEETMKSVSDTKLPNMFSDESPPDDNENLLTKSAAQKIATAKSNNDSTHNNEILIKNNEKENIESLTNIANNPPQYNESNIQATIGDSNNFIQINEAEKKENTIDETSKINDPTKQFLNKPTMHSVFIPTIFDETPPDDNCESFSTPTKSNLQETDIFEASTDNFNFNITQKVPSVSNYDSVVFEDTPPDDNNDDNTSIFSQKNDELTKSAFQNIIIDNTFTDTKIATEKTQIQTNSIFDNEPPTDSFNHTGEKKFDESKKSHLVEEENLTVSDLIKKASAVNKESDTGISNSKPTLGPKKLSTTLNINVAALIPGAKRPILASANKDESDGNIYTKLESSNLLEESRINLIEKNTEKRELNSTNIKQATDEQSEEKKLICLNKNRAKIPQKRRPSSKFCRLESYKKSLADNENENNIEEVDNININNESETTTIEKNYTETNVLLQKSNNLFTDNESSLTKPNDDQEFSKTDGNKLQPAIETSSNQNTNVLKQSSNQLNTTNQSEIRSAATKAFSFTDNNDYDDDDDSLFTQQRILSNSKKVTGNTKENELSHNLEDSDNIEDFNNLLTSSTDLKKKAKLPSKDKNNDDWLFEATSKSNTIEKIVNFSEEIKPQSKKVRNPLIFDENDLFSGHTVKTRSNKVHKQTVKENTIKPTENLPNIENEEDIFKKIKMYKKKPIKKETISIVDDTIKNSTKPIENLKTKSIGLFDSDDDDDLFGNNSSNKRISIKNNTATMENNKKFLNVPKRDNLFDDIDDDDDDLFGTKTSKAQSAVTKKIIEKPKINQSQGESTGYNPLADLLNKK